MNLRTGTVMSLTNTATGRLFAAYLPPKVVERLLARDARVVLSARSEVRAADALASLRARFPNADLGFLPLDVSDLRSVVRASDTLLSQGEPLDVLVNNAGIAGFRGLSPQGYEITFATNHLGPYLLTARLLPLLKQSRAARIVNIASVAQFNVKSIPWDRLETPVVMPLQRFWRYSVTKLMNVLHARELARRLEGSSVTTYAVHPGVVASDIWRKLPPIVRPLSKVFMVSVDEGVQTQLSCATDPSLATHSGRYYAANTEATPSKLAEDPALAQRLFEVSDAYVQRSL